MAGRASAAAKVPAEPPRPSLAPKTGMKGGVKVPPAPAAKEAAKEPPPAAAEQPAGAAVGSAGRDPPSPSVSPRSPSTDSEVPRRSAPAIHDVAMAAVAAARRRSAPEKSPPAPVLDAAPAATLHPGSSPGRPSGTKAPAAEPAAKGLPPAGRPPPKEPPPHRPSAAKEPLAAATEPPADASVPDELIARLKAAMEEKGLFYSAARAYVSTPEEADGLLSTIGAASRFTAQERAALRQWLGQPAAAVRQDRRPSSHGGRGQRGVAAAAAAAASGAGRGQGRRQEQPQDGVEDRRLAPDSHSDASTARQASDVTKPPSETRQPADAVAAGGRGAERPTAAAADDRLLSLSAENAALREELRTLRQRVDVLESPARRSVDSPAAPAARHSVVPPLPPADEPDVSQLSDAAIAELSAAALLRLVLCSALRGSTAGLLRLGRLRPDAPLSASVLPLVLSARGALLPQLVSDSGGAVDVNAAEYGVPPLLHICRLAAEAGDASGTTAGVAALLRCGADPNAADGSTTALHVAAAARLPELVDLLVDGGADTAVRDGGLTPLLLACHPPPAHAATVAAILKHAGTDASAAVADAASLIDGCTPLHLACLSDDAEACAVLLRHGADALGRGPGCAPHGLGALSPLQLACRDGCLSAVRAIVRERPGILADPRCTTAGAGPAAVAYSCGHTRLADLLLAWGGTSAGLPDGDGHGLLAVAVAAGNLAAVRQLAAEGPPAASRLVVAPGADCRRETPPVTALQLAVLQGQAAAAQLLADGLLLSGADPRRAFGGLVLGGGFIDACQAAGLAGLIARLVAGGASIAMAVPAAAAPGRVQCVLSPVRDSTAISVHPRSSDSAFCRIAPASDFLSPAQLLQLEGQLAAAPAPELCAEPRTLLPLLLSGWRDERQARLPSAGRSQSPWHTLSLSPSPPGNLLSSPPGGLPQPAQRAAPPPQRRRGSTSQAYPPPSAPDLSTDEDTSAPDVWTDMSAAGTSTLASEVRRQRRPLGARAAGLLGAAGTEQPL